MDIKRWLANSPMMVAAGVIMLTPATSMAMNAPNYGADQASCDCSTATISPQARDLLNDVWWDAGQIAVRTGSLQTYADSPNVDRGVQDRQFQQIRSEVADMSNRLVQLDGMEQSLPASEQRAINEAAPVVRSMVNDTADAFGDLKADIQYGGYTQILNDEARTVERDIDDGEHTADLRQSASY